MMGLKHRLGVALVVTLALVAISARTPVSGHQQATGDKSNFCQGCRSLVSFARTFNSSRDRVEYKDLFRNFCQLYYPVSTDFQQGPCPIFVEGLFYTIDHIDPVEHCDQIGACGQGLEGNEEDEDIAGQRPPPTRQANVICEFCEQIVEQTQATLSNPKVIEQVKRQVDALCEYLAVVDQDKQCKQLANKYIDGAIDFIKHVDPKDYCRSIQLCGQNSSMRRRLLKQQPESAGQQQQQLARLPTLTDFNNFGIETSVTIGGRPQVISSSSNHRQAVASGDRTSELRNHRRGPNCVICKTIVKEMFHFLKDNKTEQNIMVGLDKVCRLIYRRGTELDQCESMVKAYTKELIQLLIDETDPEMICMLLEQCVHSSNSALAAADHTARRQQSTFSLAHLISALDPSIPLESGRACFECKLFVRYLRDRLEEPKSQDYLREWLIENLCMELGDNDLSRSCTKMVDDYSATFFKAVLGSLRPQEACHELGVCKAAGRPAVWSGERLVIDNLAPTSSSRSPLLSQQPGSHGQPSGVQQRRRRPPTQGAAAMMRRLGGQVCDECVDIVHQLDVYLSTHSIDGDVSQLIEQVCNKLPAEAAKMECAYLVRAFGADIAQLIAQMDSPKQLCSKIMLCSVGQQ